MRNKALHKKVRKQVKKKIKTRYKCYYCGAEIISPIHRAEKKQLDLFGVPLIKKMKIGHHIRYDTNYVVNVCSKCHAEAHLIANAIPNSKVITIRKDQKYLT